MIGRKNKFLLKKIDTCRSIILFYCMVDSYKPCNYVCGVAFIMQHGILLKIGDEIGGNVGIVWLRKMSEK
jgi:hypothetical protein